jgi:hypothetical protein
MVIVFQTSKSIDINTFYALIVLSTNLCQFKWDLRSVSLPCFLVITPFKLLCTSEPYQSLCEGETCVTESMRDVDFDPLSASVGSSR